MKQKILLIAVSLATAAALQAADLIQLRSTPKGNKIRIEGDSNIHAWQVESSIIGGTAEVGPGFPLKPGAEVKLGPVEAKVNVFIPVNQLKSLKKDGSPYSSGMDNRMYEGMSEPQNKRITYTSHELVLEAVPKTAEEPYQYKATGELVVAGVTNKIKMPVMVTPLPDNKVKFAGTVTVKMTDFKIEPPALTVLGLGIKTEDDVKLFFEWVAAQKADAGK